MTFVRERFRVIEVAVLAGLGCTVPPVEIGEKGCPCIEGYSCRIRTGECFIAPTAPVVGLGCIIYVDRKLYCSNDAPSNMHAEPVGSSPVVNELLTQYSYFECWGTGELHQGGNTTWYYAQGDDGSHTYGWLPGFHVKTPSTFDGDPRKYGFSACAPP